MQLGRTPPRATSHAAHAAQRRMPWARAARLGCRGFAPSLIALACLAALLGGAWSGTRLAQAQPVDVRPSRVQVDGTTILVDGRPFVIRAIEYQGEPMGTLREMGFNTLWLSSAPSLDQLSRAREQDLWMIAPPPTDDGPVSLDWQYDAVLAWLVGQEVQSLDQGTVRQRVERIRQLDPRQGRPVLVQARSGLADYARVAEILCVGRAVLGTSFPLTEYGAWVRAQHELTQAYAPLLAEIQTELPESLAQQASLFSGVNAPLTLQEAQLRGQVWEAVSGGARGFLFRSRSRLDEPSMVSPMRRMQLTMVNRQIMQLSPWIAGALVAERLQQTDPSLRVAVLKTSRSRLLLVHQSTGLESYTAGVSRQSLLTMRDSAAGSSDQPYRLTPVGLLPATHQRLGGQMAIQIENAADWEALVLTQDPLVVRVVEQISRASQGWTMQQLHVELSQLSAEWGNRIFSAMLQAGREPSGLRERILRVNQMAQLTQAQVASSDALAVWNESLEQQRELAGVYDELVREAQQTLPWPQGSPLAVNPVLIPLHWQSLTRLSGIEWSPNALPGGDFEDLGHLSRHGWQHQTAPGLAVRTLVQLHQDAMVDGRRGLRLAAEPDGGLAPQFLESAPVWIVSGPIEIPPNHLVRISGYVHVPAPLRGTYDGLVIQDSLGGRDLAQRFPTTNGWQPFTVYRATSEGHTLRLNFALTGYGTVHVDEVTVQFAPQPGNSVGPGVTPIAPTVPASPTPTPVATGLESRAPLPR